MQGAVADERERGEVETELVRRARAGDREAFGRLVERYMRRAYFAALGLVGSHEDALDLSQEAFVRAFSARARIDPDRPFYVWFYAILRRLCFNFLRDRKARGRRLDAERGWIVAEASARARLSSPDRALALEEMRRLLQSAIEALPDQEREVLVLREFEGSRYREIADLLGVPIGTVMSRLYSARRRLADALAEDA